VLAWFLRTLAETNELLRLLIRTQGGDDTSVPAVRPDVDDTLPGRP